MWKNKIEPFIKSIYFDLWYVIVDGSYKVLIIKKGKTREKTKKVLNENYKKMLAQNIQVMNILCKVLDEDEQKRIEYYKSAQPM